MMSWIQRNWWRIRMSEMQFVCAVDANGIRPAINTLYSASLADPTADLILATDRAGVQEYLKIKDTIRDYETKFKSRLMLHEFSIPEVLLNYSGPRFGHITPAFLYRLLLDQLPRKITFNLDYDLILLRSIDHHARRLSKEKVIGFTSHMAPNHPLRYHINASFFGFDLTDDWVLKSFEEMRKWIPHYSDSKYTEEDCFSRVWFEDRNVVPDFNHNIVCHCRGLRKHLWSNPGKCTSEFQRALSKYDGMHFISEMKPWSVPLCNADKIYQRLFLDFYRKFDVTGICRKDKTRGK